MKKILPYIVILIITYLVTGFVKMEFNPQYWTVDNRIGMVCFTSCVMLLYPIAKFMINDMKQ